MLAQNQGVFMRIKKVTDDYIEFDTGDTLRSYHMPACCEDNYAAFKEVDDLALEADFDQPLMFEAVFGGFRFGNEGKMFFVPCYSDRTDTTQTRSISSSMEVECSAAKVRLSDVRCETCKSKQGQKEGT